MSDIDRHLPAAVPPEEWTSLVEAIRALEADPTPEGVAEFDARFGFETSVETFEGLWRSMSPEELANELVARRHAERHAPHVPVSDLEPIVERMQATSSPDEAFALFALLQAHPAVVADDVSDLVYWPLIELAPTELVHLLRTKVRSGLEHRSLGAWLLDEREPSAPVEHRPRLDHVRLERLREAHPDLPELPPEVVVEKLAEAFGVEPGHFAPMVEQWRRSYTHEGLRRAMGAATR